jgi:hypothetical protein
MTYCCVCPHLIYLAGSSDIYRFQLYTLLNPHLSNLNKLSANITLHQIQNNEVQNYTKEYNSTKDSAEGFLSLAAMNYNINNTTNAENFLGSIQRLLTSKKTLMLSGQAIKIQQFHV